MTLRLFLRPIAGLLALACAAPVLAQTTTQIRSTPNPSNIGQTVEIVAEVSGVGAPSGVFVLRDGESFVTAATAIPIVGESQTTMGLGLGHSCALRGGSLRCSGLNGSGQLGDGTVTQRTVPVPVSGLGSDIVAIAAGETHTCALTRASGVRCWGNNGAGRLGDNTTINRAAPVTPVGLSGPGTVAVAAGGAHTCALSTGGAVLCWGDNGFGQLGDGTRTARRTPTPVSGLSSGVVAIAAGGLHTCAVTGVGDLFCWGENSSGQVGDNSTNFRVTPTRVPVPEAVAAVALGASHSCAIAASRALYCWGSNSAGQLGDNSLVNRLTPTRLNVTSARAITAGRNHSCALIGVENPLGAEAHCWGDNSSGQIGDNSVTNRLLPTQVRGFEVGGAIAIFAGGAHSCVSSRRGSTQCWGGGANGQLANGSNAQHRAPTGTFFALNNFASRFRLGTASLTRGEHVLTASFIAAEGFIGSSASTTHQVNGVVTTTSLAASPNPSVFGQTVTISATISPGNFVTGSMRFFRDNVLFATAPVTTRVTSVTVTAPAGSHDWRAEYSGDNTFLPSVSTTLTQIVSRAATATTLASSVNPSLFGQPTNLTAQVASAAGTPAGSIEFFDGSTRLGSAALDDGLARIAVANLPPGPHSLTAAYSGEANFDVSTSDPLAQEVTIAQSRVSLVASQTHVKPGKRVTLTASVSPAPPSTVIPAGPVSFRQNGAEIGVGALNGEGTASIETGRLPLGTHDFEAVFGGSASFVGAASPPVRVAADYKIGPETIVNLVTAGAQMNPAAAHGATGDALIVWESMAVATGPRAIKSRHLRADGTLAPVEVAVATATTGAGAPQVAGLSNGDYAVLWHKDGASRRDIVGRIMRADGAPRSVPRVANTRLAGDQSFPALAGLPGGGYVAVWQSEGEDGSGYAIVGQRFGNDGLRIGQPFAVNTTTAGDQTAPAVTALTGGGFVVVWASPAGVGFSLFFQRFDANGQPVGTETLVDPAPSTAVARLAVTPLPLNAFLVVWDRPETDATSPKDVFARRYDGAGAPEGAPFRVNLATAGPQADPAASLLDGGRSAVIAWTTPDAHLSGVAAEAFTPLGGRIENAFLANTNQLSWERAPSIAPLGAGLAIGKTYVIVWCSLAGDQNASSIQLQRFVAP